MLGYHLLVLLNHGLNKFEFSRLKAVVLNQLYRKQSEFRTYVPLDHMNMNRLMVIGIEHESEPKQNEYCRHIFPFTGQI